VIGLTWAIFVAGSPTTVVSQWKVDSSSTSELMLHFYRTLKSATKVTKSEALRAAALELMKSGPYRHPFYWAGFVVVGDGF
jgi:CHAT domain-containing protein